MEPRSTSTDSFWGSARDLGLTSIAVLTFAGLVYEYTYLHDLGVDFAAVDVSPSASLIAMSKVAVADVWFVVGAFAVAIALRAFAGHRVKYHHERWALRLLLSLRTRFVQTALALLAALLVCITASATASSTVARLRGTEGANRISVTFRSDVATLYPAELLKANTDQSLRLMYDSPTTLFVMLQPASGAIAGVLPDAVVYELHKDDVLSIRTSIPPLAKGRS